MVNFIKDSFRELQHVVWPTRAETKVYFTSVLVVLIAFGIYLALANAFFKQILFSLGNLF